MDSCTDNMKLQDNVDNVSSIEQHPFSSQNESFQEATLIAINYILLQKSLGLQNSNN